MTTRISEAFVVFAAEAFVVFAAEAFVVFAAERVSLAVETSGSSGHSTDPIPSSPNRRQARLLVSSASSNVAVSPSMQIKYETRNNE